MQDVADLAGVSRALVSLVMRESPSVSPHRRAAVLDAVDQLGYRPNVLARNLARRRTMTLGVMVNDLHNPFFAETIDGIQKAAEHAGYSILLATGGATRAGEAGAIETFLRFRVDGLVLTGPRLSSRQIAEVGADCPTVLLGRTVRSTAVDTVNNDEIIGSGLAVKHLVDLGHERIAHIDGGSGAGAAPRRAGYERAMNSHGLNQRIRVVGGDFTEASGAAGARVVLASGERPSAIFVANDLMACGALDAILDLGLEVPGDVSLVGYDNSAISALHHISLTTIHQPREEMGRTSVEILLDRIQNGRSTAVRHIVTPALLVRSSSSPPSAELGRGDRPARKTASQ